MRTLGALMALMTIVAPSVASARKIVMIGAVIKPNQRMGFLIDVDTIRSVGAYKRAWTYDAIKISGDKMMLMSELVEVDCDQERYRSLSTNWYEPDQALGVTNKDPQWKYAVPNSSAESTVKITCGLMSMPEKNTLGDEDPLILLRKFMEAAP